MRLPNLTNAGDLLRWAADFVRVLEIQLRAIEQAGQSRGTPLQLPPPYDPMALPNAAQANQVILVSETPDTVIMAVSVGGIWRKIQIGDPV